MDGLFQLGSKGPFRSLQVLSLIALVANVAFVASAASDAVPYHPVREGDAMWLEDPRLATSDAAKLEKSSSSDDVEHLGSRDDKAVASGAKAEELAGIPKPKMQMRGLAMAAISLAVLLGMMLRGSDQAVFMIALAVAASAGIAEFVASRHRAREAEEKHKRAMELLRDMEEGRAKDIVRRNLRAPVPPAKPVTSRALWVSLGLLIASLALAGVSSKGYVPLFLDGFLKGYLAVALGTFGASAIQTLIHKAEDLKWKRLYKEFMENYELPENKSDKTDGVAAAGAGDEAPATAA